MTVESELLTVESPTFIEDITCEISTVREANTKQLNAILNDLLKTTFFRLYQVPEDSFCPLNPPTEEAQDSNDEGTAEQESCGATFGNDFGPLFNKGLFGEVSSLNPMDTGNGVSKCSLESEDELDLSMTFAETRSLEKEENLNCDDESSPNFWLNICESLETKESSKDQEFVNLQKNIEHYTGYNGSKIWKAIYKENCFHNFDSSDMCVEERVLYKLTSGLHASINTHVALNFFDTGAQNLEFKSNPQRFVEAVGSHSDRVQNLYFTFTFLLRAVKKAEPILLDVKFGDENEQKQVLKLLRHLLEADALDSCQSVFQGFDEKILFPRALDEKERLLKRNFKQTFLNISSLFNCIKCQRCKLHGKMQLLGIGTALKILLLPDDLSLLDLNREEIVSLLNTLGKFSESIEAIPKLIEQYWQEKQPIGMVDSTSSTTDVLLGKAVQVLSESHLFREAHPVIQDGIVDRLLGGDRELRILLNFLKTDNSEAETIFARQVLRLFPKDHLSNQKILVVGGGLSGLTAALTLLDRGASNVVLIEGNSLLGGNSVRASSGVNAVSFKNETSKALYLLDTVSSHIGKSRKDVSAVDLSDFEEFSWFKKIKLLVEGSETALDFLKGRLGFDMEPPSRLGGHSEARTYRPKKGIAGAEIISKLVSEVRAYEAKGKIEILTDTTVEELIFSKDESIRAVKYIRSKETSEVEVEAMVLATGGYAYTGKHNKWLKAKLLEYASTNGAHAVGSGLTLVKDVAEFVDLNQVQVHPTAFYEPVAKGVNEWKLCAEVLRGVGGILLDGRGKRFVNELDKRDNVVKAMKALGSEYFHIVLNEASAEKVSGHVKTYTRGKHLMKVEGIEQLSAYIDIPVTTLRSTFASYISQDEFGRSSKVEKQGFQPHVAEEISFYVGKVAPAVHYTMGGIKVNSEFQVLSAISSGTKPISNLYAVGEVVGGIHGKNRLGGNALTECIVFGLKVGKSISVSSVSDNRVEATAKSEESKQRILTLTEVYENSSKDSCWVVLGLEGEKEIYDLTEFADKHPAGPDSILQLCGTDGSMEFEEVHSYDLLRNYGLKSIGKLSRV
eukprot:snap_masked-scaffold_31-processed-gene-2.30-mRNA-1 protein AED:0.36 eAED:0.36 QI:0/-1/0/1/-1/1/1/0/1071